MAKLVQPGWKYVVQNSEELKKALQENVGFIVQAGEYEIDLAGLVIPSGNRLIMGAGKEEVKITINGTTELDFSSGIVGLGAQGVSMEDLTLVHGGAAGLTYMVKGLASARNVAIDNSAQAGADGFETCYNLDSCFVSDGDKGFVNCINLDKCAATDCATYGYEDCTRLTLCTATTCDTGFHGVQGASSCYVDTATDIGFEDSTHLSGCEVAGATTGYDDCFHLTACTIDTATTGFNDCDNVSSCQADGCTFCYSACLNLSSCNGSGAFTTAFNYCNQVTSCRASGGSVGVNGYVGCNEVTGCIAVQVTGTGYNSCNRVSGCRANSCDQYGYYISVGVTSSRADNSSIGFYQCDNISSCRCQANSVDYQECERIIGCQGTIGTGNSRIIDDDFLDAADGANSPDSGNALATIDDINNYGSVPGSLIGVWTESQSFGRGTLTFDSYYYFDGTQANWTSHTFPVNENQGTDRAAKVYDATRGHYIWAIAMCESGDSNDANDNGYSSSGDLSITNGAPPSISVTWSGVGTRSNRKSCVILLFQADS